MGTHSLSRGAGRAILESAGLFARPLSSVYLHSSALQPYLGLGSEETESMAPILIEVP